MDSGLLFFWLDDDGSIHNLSATKLGKICKRAEPMEEFVGRCVPVIAVLLDVVDRKAQRIRHVGGMKLYVSGDGYIDQDRHMEAFA